MIYSTFNLSAVTLLSALLLSSAQLETAQIFAEAEPLNEAEGQGLRDLQAGSLPPPLWEGGSILLDSDQRGWVGAKARGWGDKPFARIRRCYSMNRTALDPPNYMYKTDPKFILTNRKVTSQWAALEAACRSSVPTTGLAIIYNSRANRTHRAGIVFRYGLSKMTDLRGSFLYFGKNNASNLQYEDMYQRGMLVNATNTQLGGQHLIVDNPEVGTIYLNVATLEAGTYYVGSASTDQGIFYLAAGDGTATMDWVQRFSIDTIEAFELIQ